VFGSTKGTLRDIPDKHPWIDKILVKGANDMSKLEEIAQAVEGGKSKIIAGLVEEALAEGIDPVKILNEGMIATMGIVGEKFKNAEIFVPEMLVAARAMKKGVEVLKPKLAGDKSIIAGKAIIGTVSGDLHDIGKNLVAMMIESAGFEVIDLVVDVSSDKFIETVKANPDTKIVAVSGLLTTTMPAMKDTVAAIKNSGLSGFKVIVGGAPITQEYADQIGADGYSPDAASAAVLAKKLA
jgi:methanogenic corrinoid protein MtbC1